MQNRKKLLADPFFRWPWRTESWCLKGPEPEGEKEKRLEALLREGLDPRESLQRLPFLVISGDEASVNLGPND